MNLESMAAVLELYSTKGIGSTYVSIYIRYTFPLSLVTTAYRGYGGMAKDSRRLRAQACNSQNEVCFFYGTLQYLHKINR